MSKSTAQVLREAKALIDSPEKWWKSDIRGGLPTGCFPSDRICAGRAIALVCGERYHDLCDLIRKASGAPNWHTLPYWNDAPERTHAEVMDAFDRAITLAEQEASQ